MFSLLFVCILLLLLIINSQLVCIGASYGLMLWYQNVIPLLLPFMLISSLIEDSIISMYKTSKRTITTAIPIATIICTGLFCGYPMGAKSCTFFLENSIITKRCGNLLLPLCNNISPMFFTGYILSNILDNTVNIYHGYFAIFLPYIVLLCIELLLYPKGKQKNEDKTKLKPQIANHAQTTNNAETCIQQITFVGLYIMICSIISEFIINTDILSQKLKIVLTGILEITRGASYISDNYNVCSKIKTALILACTSFGGISSILQTNKVITASGLSLLHYVFAKATCATATFFIYILII